MSIHQYQALFADALVRLDWNRNPQGLYQPIGYALSVGGKHLRPALLLMAAELYHAKTDAVMPAALALELFHNFTLLHDDLMDNSPTRRGQATVQKKWGANTAILSGDQMLVSAYQQLAKADISDADMRKAFDMFNTMAEQICQGQQYDMDFEKRDDVSVAEYMQMITLKTSVLLATSLQMGAMLAGAPDDHCKMLYKFGINLGIAFQLRDDYLDVYATSAAFGKTLGTDIVNNKKTYLLLQALDLAKGSIRNELEYWLQPAQSSDAEAKIAAVKEIYDKLNISALTLQAIEKYTAAAISVIQQLPVEDESKKDFIALTGELLKRNK